LGEMGRNWAERTQQGCRAGLDAKMELEEGGVGKDGDEGREGGPVEGPGADCSGRQKVPSPGVIWRLRRVAYSGLVSEVPE
jgi:hypothetical protein